MKDLSTNDIRRASTQANGVYTFLNLPGGTYSMRISAQAFSSQVFQSVVIRTSLETEVHVALKIGTTAESITVSDSEVPLVQTEASALATNFDTKQVFNLPEINRNAWGLVYQVPGYASGTFNNLPGAAIVAADFDGVQSMSNRFREGGYTYGTSVIDPRLENIAEFTVATSQLDLSGNGTSAMKISIVTKRGTNQFHGLLYEDFRNTVLNANTWSNNANVNAQGVGPPRSITKYSRRHFGRRRPRPLPAPPLIDRRQATPRPLRARTWGASSAPERDSVRRHDPPGGPGLSRSSSGRYLDFCGRPCGRIRLREREPRRTTGWRSLRRKGCMADGATVCEGHRRSSALRRMT